MTEYLPIFSGIRREGASGEAWDGMVRTATGEAAAEYERDWRVTVMQPSPVCGRRAALAAGAAARGGGSVEVIESPMREIDHRPAAHDDRAGLAAQHADARIAPFLGRQSGEQRIDATGGHAEQQLVIITACESQLARALIAHRESERARYRQLVIMQLRSATACTRELASVTEQAIGHVDAGAGEPAQPPPERDSRRRKEEPLGELARRFRIRDGEPRLLYPETGRRVPRRAAHEQHVSRRAAGARERRPAFDRAENLQARREGSRSRVAAHDCDTEAPRERVEAAAELGQPALIRPRQRQSEQRPGGLRAHRRHVAQIDRKRAMADRGGGRTGGEVHALDERIDGGDEVAACRTVDERGVVADTQTHVPARRTAAAEETIDQLEFAERHGLDPLNARAAAAPSQPDRARRSRTCIRPSRRSASRAPRPR